MRSKTYMSKINLQRGILTVENRKSREKKRICSEVSVNSPENIIRNIIPLRGRRLPTTPHHHTVNSLQVDQETVAVVQPAEDECRNNGIEDGRRSVCR